MNLYTKAPQVPWVQKLILLLNVTELLFHLVEFEKGQQDRNEGENRLGWKKYHVIKQINYDKIPEEERTGS